MTNTIDIMFELFDNISDEWKEEKIFIYGQNTDMNLDPFHAFENTQHIFGVRAKSEEEGRILLHFQSTIIEGYGSATRTGGKIIDIYYNNMTVDQLKDYILKNKHIYEIHIFDLGKNILLDVKALKEPNWIEKYYTGNSKNFLKSYKINVKESEIVIWNMDRVKKELDNIREQ
uniref:Uncharacterized protein n=1 Tax=Pithovirus LCPAC401 TaxID=2506595 RepID=A0A481Z9F9_9VIRU|nr:MAG: hypothetical protein LCPAC401_00750 [Pithovirus LCPAC401]